MVEGRFAISLLTYCSVRYLPFDFVFFFAVVRLVAGSSSENFYLFDLELLSVSCG